jgi:hypothetical protein
MANNVVNIVIGLLVVGWVLSRQLRIRQANEQSATRLILILGVVGIVETARAMQGHSLSALTVALIVGEIAIGAGLGVARAATTRVWRDGLGVAWRQGSWITAALWIAAIAAHLGLDVLVDHQSGIDGLGSAGILLYLAISLGVQRELIRLRAARIPLRWDAAAR